MRQRSISGTRAASGSWTPGHESYPWAGSFGGPRGAGVKGLMDRIRIPSRMAWERVVSGGCQVVVGHLANPPALPEQDVRLTQCGDDVPGPEILAWRPPSTSSNPLQSLFPPGPTHRGKITLSVSVREGGPVKVVRDAGVL